MSFFAVLFALLIEQLKPLPRDNLVHDTLTGWMRWAGRNFDAGRDHHAWVVWCITVLVPALLVALAYRAIGHFSLLLALAFDVAVLYLTLGFRQLSRMSANSVSCEMPGAVRASSIAKETGIVFFITVLPAAKDKRHAGCRGSRYCRGRHRPASPKRSC